MKPTQTGENTTPYVATQDFDYRDYLHFIDDDVSEEQKQEFIVTLWQIVGQFTDMGFGIEATQRALASIFEPNAAQAQSQTEKEKTGKENAHDV